jgi:hypothetical protein
VRRSAIIPEFLRVTTHPNGQDVCLSLTKQAAYRAISLVRSHREPFAQSTRGLFLAAARMTGPLTTRLGMTDGKLALVYLIIVAIITLSYSDDESIGLMKRAITALVVAQVQAATE